MAPSRPRGFHFLAQLDELLGDQERRAKMPARGPIPKKGGDPSARIAALIRDLDQIDEQQMMSSGAAQLGNSPLVQDLIAEGDPAVAPLLEVLESDNRLTRSVSEIAVSRLERFVHPVYEAAFAALIGILKTREFDKYRSYGWKTVDPAARKALAGSMRQFWEKTRSVPLVERWYQTLLDDSAGPARWLEAAGGIVQPDVAPGMPYPKPGTRPMKGEPFRVGRDPSVTALMLRRARQIERMGDSQQFSRAGIRRRLPDGFNPGHLGCAGVAARPQGPDEGMPGPVGPLARSREPGERRPEPRVVLGRVHPDPGQARRPRRPSTSMPTGSGRPPRRCWNTGPSTHCSRCWPIPITRHWPRPRDGCSTTRSLPGSRSSPKPGGSSRRTSRTSSRRRSSSSPASAKACSPAWRTRPRSGPSTQIDKNTIERKIKNVARRRLRPIRTSTWTGSRSAWNTDSGTATTSPRSSRVSRAARVAISSGPKLAATRPWPRAWPT